MATDPNAPIAPIDVDEILKHPFSTVRRGYDPLEVQNFLMALASGIRASVDREEDLRGALTDAEARAEAAAQLDPTRLTALLGEETARIVETARQAGDAIRARAEEDAAHLRAEASAEAQRVRREAEDVLAKARQDAEKVEEEGRLAGAAALEQAQAEAGAAAEAGRQRGREMVAEAQQVRERMLRDLARRRKSLRQQIEQLQVGRDRLLSAYEVVRETLAVATDELQVALPEAKQAAERMGPSVAAALSDAVIDRELDELRAEVGVVDEVASVAREDEPADPEESAPDLESAGTVDAGRVESGKKGSRKKGSSEAEPIAGDVDQAAPVAHEAPGLSQEDRPGTDADLVVDRLEGEGAGMPRRAPDPVEGRHSSAVRVIRTGETPIIEVDVEDAEPIDGLEEPDTPTPDTPNPVLVAKEGTNAQVSRPDGGDAAPDPALVAESATKGEVSRPEGAASVAGEVDADAVAAGELDEDGGETSGSPTTRRTKGGRQVSSIFARMKDQAARGPSRAEPALQPSPTIDEPEAETDEVPPDLELTGDAAVIAQRDLVVEPLEQNLARRLKRELSDDQNELMDSVRKTRGVPSATQVMPTPESQVERFAGVILPNLVAAAAAGADFADRIRGVESEQGPVSVSLTGLAEELAAELVAPLRGRIERSFSACQGSAETLDEDLRNAYREWKAQSVDEPSAHAVLAAFNRGLVDHLRSGTKVRWIVDDPGHPSPDCEDNALAGNVVAGKEFPTGHTAPPVHAFCRCLVVPEPG